MQELSWNKYEIFSKACVPPENPFFLRLDGWKFKKLSGKIKAEKPFDERVAKCLVSSGKILFEKGFNPALIYVVSDEINVLFLSAVPFCGRIEKMDSVLSGLVSSSFTLSIQKFFGTNVSVAFDSRVVIVSDEEKTSEYLVWRQMDAWRNPITLMPIGFSEKWGSSLLKFLKSLKG
jgi:tRNA(His) 5'-end guanylyltransferase